jgi:hypothetical protein
MNYLHNLPNDLRYVVFTYLKIGEVSTVSETFEIYVDYKKLMMLTYPNIFIHLREFITDVHHLWHQFLVSLEKICTDNTVVGDFFNLTHLSNLSVDANIDVVNILCEIKLKLRYPDLYPIFKMFPEDKYKYKFIYDAMIQLEIFHNIPNLKTLIMSKVTLEFVRWDIWDGIARVEFDAMMNHCFCYILILKYKFNLTKGNHVIDFAEGCRVGNVFPYEYIFKDKYICYDAKLLYAILKFEK